MAQFEKGELCVVSAGGLKKNGCYVDLLNFKDDGTFKLQSVESIQIEPGDLIVIFKKVQEEDFQFSKKVYKRYYENRWIAIYKENFILIRQGTFKKAKNAICTP